MKNVPIIFDVSNKSSCVPPASMFYIIVLCASLSQLVLCDSLTYCVLLYYSSFLKLLQFIVLTSLLIDMDAVCYKNVYMILLEHIRKS